MISEAIDYDYYLKLITKWEPTEKDTLLIAIFGKQEMMTVLDYLKNLGYNATPIGSEYWGTYAIRINRKQWK